MDRFTIGDSFNKLEIQILDENRAPRVISGWSPRLFVEGNASSDRPGDTDSHVVAAVSFVKGVRAITRLTGSFSADNVKVGSLIIVDGLPEGAQVLTVAALSLGIDAAPTKDGTNLSARFWFGLPLAHTATDDMTGLCRIAIGQYLDPGALLSDVYRGAVRADITTPLSVGWSNASRGVIEFEGVRP